MDLSNLESNIALLKKSDRELRIMVELEPKITEVAVRFKDAGLFDLSEKTIGLLKDMIEHLRKNQKMMIEASEQKENWESISVPAGAARHGKKLVPMPDGPYLVVSQNDNTNYNGITWDDVMKDHFDKIQYTKPESLGTVAYYFTNDCRAKKCFWFFDTSD